MSLGPSTGCPPHFGMRPLSGRSPAFFFPGQGLDRGPSGKKILSGPPALSLTTQTRVLPPPLLAQPQVWGFTGRVGAAYQ